MKKALVIFFALLILTAFCACTEQINETSVKNLSEPESDKNESSLESSGNGDPLANESSDYSDNESKSDPSFEASGETSDEASNDINRDETSVPDDNGEDEETSTPLGKDDNDGDEEEDEEEEIPNYTYGDAEFLESGYLLYNGSLYSRTYYLADISKRYADVYAKYAELFPNTRISVINPPLSAINITNPLVRDMVNDQGAVLDMMESDIYGNVNFVNIKNTILAHRGEYLYFKSDWHWTQLGAYYAYTDFARSIGLTPTPLSEFRPEIVTNEFIGALANVTEDERVYSFKDTVIAYLPRKAHTMTITNGDRSDTYDRCIHTYIENYSCFIVGDNALTTINVPSNDQSKTVLVIKESSANPFVPFLIEHYGNIIVIDPRHIDIDIRSMVSEKGIDDIIFFAMASTSNRSTYCNYYERMIGIR